MRIGYLFHGHMCDIKLDSDGNEVSTPDGNATYSWTIEHECDRRERGYKLIPLGENLDAPAVTNLGEDAFSAFSQRKRVLSFERMLKRGWARLSDRKLPELDLVLIEWRWSIPGRNTPDDAGGPSYQRDLERQTEVLRHYSDEGTPIVIWDLDHKLTADDVSCFEGSDIRVIETAVAPNPWATRVEPPFVTADLLQHDIDDRTPKFHLGYVGSRYERDATIDHWIRPISPPRTHRVGFWGKWEPNQEVRERWPGVQFHGRIGVRGFREAYSRVAAVPLLAKESYYRGGFITPRPFEAVLFGSIPIGLSGHLGIEQYAERVATSPDHLFQLATELRNVSSIRRRVMRAEAAHRLSQMDVRHFVDVLTGSGKREADVAVPTKTVAANETEDD